MSVDGVVNDALNY